MNAQSDELATKDYFEFFIAYYPDFPAETPLTGREAIEKLINRVETAARAATNDMGRHWLTLCRCELDVAASANKDGDVKLAKRALTNACEYFDDFLAGRKISVDYFATKNGTVKKA